MHIPTYLTKNYFWSVVGLGLKGPEARLK